MAGVAEPRAGGAGQAGKRWPLFALAAALAIALAAALAAAPIWEYARSGELLGKLAAAVTVLSVVIAPIVYFAKLGRKERDLRRQAEVEKKMMSDNLRGEMSDALDAPSDPDFLREASFEKKSAKFANRLLNHGTYDGLVFSGKIGFLRADLQQETQDVFQLVKYSHGNK